VAFALQADGWYLRQDIIWAKPNPMPESVKDRCTKSHEYIFLLSKSAKYYYDHEAIKEPAVYPNDNRGSRKDIRRGTECNSMSGVTGVARNKRDVWTVTTKPFKGAHFATFPPDLITPCILAGAPEGGTVIDPFSGAGTVGLVCKEHNRNFVGIELNPEYVAMSRGRIDAHIQTVS
jgi:DNA modification methylase